MNPKLFLSLMLLWAACLSPLTAAEFYVAVTGNDAHSGTLDSPFATVQRAQKAAEPGDTVWVRGGIYLLSETQIAQTPRGRAHVTLLDKSGRDGAPIRYWAYQDEKPVFDLSAVKPARLRVTAFRVDGSWLHLKGITVTGVQVTITRHTQSICFDNQGDHNVFEQLTMRDGQAIGFWLGSGSHNLVLNCDAYRNHDYTSENGRGVNVDGFGFHAPKGSVNNVFRGCRAWFNSDDGFDFINTSEPVTVENCWAFYNGFNADFRNLGDGHGFKAGGYARRPASELPDPIPRHVVRQCLAVRNKAAGFYANHQPGGIDWLNNTAYRNSVNFNMLGRNLTDVTDVPGYGHKMKNNLGYKGRTELSNLNAAASEVSGNYFNLPVEIDDSDFAGMDEADLIKPRQANGDLPRVSFLRLVKGSDLIDAGTDIGLPFFGTAPDLGVFEAGLEDAPAKP
ncbi:MAG TPA: right-handed parallel beta-helix repeat-containing protein [Chthoniobacteraceae bacterium]|nr:right-handed parallel beta-helix repeat-containing protein [Chthoniobacteraceae bacterium]